MGPVVRAIADLVELIKDELDGAERYAKLGVKAKDTDAQLSKVYSDLANEELKHVTSLHGQVARLIKEKNASGVETPAAMQMVWDWEHDKLVDHEARVKAMLTAKM